MILIVRYSKYSKMKANCTHLAAFLHRHPWIAPVMVAFLVHLPGIFGSFVYDDVPLIQEHPELSRVHFATEIWSRDYGLEFARQPKGYYRPLFMTLLFGIYSICGPNPIVFHSFSLLFLLAATALVTAAAARTAPERPRLAIFIGMLYALHPARVETASLFMSLPDLIVEIGALVTFLTLLRKDDAAYGQDPFQRLAVCLFVALAAGLTKESAFFYLAPLAATATIRAIYERGRPTVIRTLAAPLGTIMGLAAALAARLLAGIHAPASVSESMARLLDNRSMPALQTLASAIREFVIPGHVVFWRQLPSSYSDTATVVVLLILVLLVAGWALLLLTKRYGLALLLGWVGGSILSLLLLTAGNYPYSQRYLAVAPALILLCLAGHHVLHSLWRSIVPKKIRMLRGFRRLPAFVLALYLTFHGAYTLLGVFQCRSPLGFFLTIHKENPHAVVPLGAVAQSLNDIGAPAVQIESRVRQATALDPKHPQIPLLHNMVIKRYLADEDFVAALRFADWSLELFPNDTDKMSLRAVALADLRRYKQALTAIDQAITKRPDQEAYRLLQSQIQENMKADSLPHFDK